MPRSRSLATSAASCLGGVTAVALALPAMAPLDRAWHRAVLGSRYDEMMRLAMALDWYGHFTAQTLLLTAIAVLLLALGRWRAALFIVIGRILVSLATAGVKELVGTDRPADRLVEISSYAFPSGHVSGAAGMLILVAAVVPPRYRHYWWPVGLVFTIALIWCRTYLGAHWLADTIGGALLGAGVALAWWWLAQPMLDREQTGPGNPLPLSRSRG